MIIYNHKCLLKIDTDYRINYGLTLLQDEKEYNCKKCDGETSNKICFKTLLSLLTDISQTKSKLINLQFKEDR